MSEMCLLAQLPQFLVGIHSMQEFTQSAGRTQNYCVVECMHIFTRFRSIALRPTIEDRLYNSFVAESAVSDPSRRAVESPTNRKGILAFANAVECKPSE